MCRSCSHQGSVTAGTIFDKTRTPLRVWLAAAWYVTNQKLGVSALGLKRVLGLGSYETAWTMLHRFRRAMVRPERELLKGEVEVDETYLAISDRDKPLSSQGRKSKTNKILVAIAVEILQPKGFGRIRLRRIDNDSDACVVPFVQENIEPGARVLHRRIGGLPLVEPRSASSTTARSCSAPSHRPTSRCPACTGWPPWSSAGSWARITARSNPGTSTPTSTSSSSASTAAHPPRAACCSTG